MSRIVQFRCFYRGKMYPVEEMRFSEDGSYGVSVILMELDGLGIRNVSPDSEHVEAIMQHTGSFDKNNKSIYEGDIFLHPHESTPCVVEYQQSAFGIRGEGISQFLCYAAQSGEVIGNIYENPDKKP